MAWGIAGGTGGVGGIVAGFVSGVSGVVDRGNGIGGADVYAGTATAAQVRVRGVS